MNRYRSSGATRRRRRVKSDIADASRTFFDRPFQTSEHLHRATVFITRDHTIKIGASLSYRVNSCDGDIGEDKFAENSGQAGASRCADDFCKTGQTQNQCAKP